MGHQFFQVVYKLTLWSPHLTLRLHQLRLETVHYPVRAINFGLQLRNCCAMLIDFGFMFFKNSCVNVRSYFYNDYSLSATLHFIF
jgi:hypothetical protein